MGFIKHHAIIVTASVREHAERARNFALMRPLGVTNIERSESNSYFTFLIVPDGSKEGWMESDRGDAARAEWLTWARDAARIVERIFIEWVVVEYGHDLEGMDKVVDSSHNTAGSAGPATASKP